MDETDCQLKRCTKVHNYESKRIRPGIVDTVLERPPLRYHITIVTIFNFVQHRYKSVNAVNNVL